MVSHNKMLMSGLQTQRKFEKFSGDENVKKTMEIFTELLAQMYIDDQALANKDPMQHLLNELDIETEVIDPDILIAENQALREEIAGLQLESDRVSTQLYDLRQQRRAGRAIKHGQKGSGGRGQGKQLTVEIKDIDDKSVSNRSRKKPNLTPSDMSRSRGGHQSHSTEQPSAVLGFLNDTGRFGEAIGSSSARNTSIIVFFTDSHLASCKRIKPSFDALSTEFTFT